MTSITSIRVAPKFCKGLNICMCIGLLVDRRHIVYFSWSQPNRLHFCWPSQYYLSRLNSVSVAGDFHYCGNKDNDVISGPLFAMSSSIPTAPAAVSEAEYAALFVNAQHGASERNVLGALRYPHKGRSCAYGDR